MKKTRTFLAITMILGAMAAFASCGEQKTNCPTKAEALIAQATKW